MGNALPKTKVKWPHRSKKGRICASKVRHCPYDISIYAIIRVPVKPDAKCPTTATWEHYNKRRRSPIFGIEKGLEVWLWLLLTIQQLLAGC